LRGRITRAGIRWGLDPEQCRADGLPDLGQHTWTHGQERLLLGHCLGQVDEPWLGVLPSAAAAASAPDWLGGLASFLRRLRTFTRACGDGLSPEKWHNLLLELVNDFFTDQDPFHDSLILIRETPIFSCIRSGPSSMIHSAWRKCGTISRDVFQAVAGTPF